MDSGVVGAVEEEDLKRNKDDEDDLELEVLDDDKDDDKDGKDLVLCTVLGGWYDIFLSAFVPSCKVEFRSIYAT